MFDRDTLVDLLQHMQWADAEVWRAVLAVDAAEQDEKLREWLVHLHTVQQAFLSVWQGQPVEFRAASSFENLHAVREWASPYYARAHAFLGACGASDLARPITMPWAEQLAKMLGRAPGTPTLVETVFQVTSHSTYHRGQVNARLRQLGGTPPLVDYIAWIWFGRPTPQT